jgi:GrpB-like predicted nucleotidyltransferase (UPF0157 family)
MDRLRGRRSLVPLRTAEELLPRARAILALEWRRLRGDLPDGELSLTGSSSLPGMLTRGDVDLHLRVRPEDFERAVRTLGATYAPVHPEIWTNGFATFETPVYELPTGIAVTAIGDEHDTLFRRTWARLASDPGLVDAYNAVKLAHEGADDAAYRAAKQRFLDSIDLDASDG